MVKTGSRRTRLTHVRRSTTKARVDLDAGPLSDQLSHPAQSLDEHAKVWHGRIGLKQISSLLWSKSYQELFEVEFHINQEDVIGGELLALVDPQLTLLADKKAAAKWLPG